MAEKIISIVIPHFKEESAKILPLLYSIHNQVGVDFETVEVIISSDGPESDPLEKIKSHDFNFDVNHIVSIENGGPGMARQNGMDAATGKYIMFCDADDIIHSVGVLSFVLEEMQANPCALLTTDWVEELRFDDGKYRYIPHTHDLTWMHGKLIDLDFVRKHGIRHHPELRVHEDSYFLSVLQACTDEAMTVRHSDVTSYVWKFYDDTITRVNNGEYSYRAFPIFIRAIGLSIEEVVKIGKLDLAGEKATQIMFYVYFLLTSPGWNDREEEKAASIKSLKDNICTPYREYFGRVSAEDFLKIYKGEREKHANFIEDQTLYDWMTKNELFPADEIKRV